jgi:hypothetical protein
MIILFPLDPVSMQTPFIVFSEIDFLLGNAMKLFCCLLLRRNLSVVAMTVLFPS